MYLNNFNCIVSRPLLPVLGLLAAVSLLSWASSNNPSTLSKIWISASKEGLEEVTAAATLPNNRLLGGLLLPDFAKETCWSRYQSMIYRKASPYILSSYLISKLRKYEELHKKCGPNTPLFKKSLQQLMSNHSTDQLECNYVLWIPYGGIGNRMLALVSTFLYALLTNRVMVIQGAGDMNDLFCEPFPGSTWYAPPDFPIHNLERYHVRSEQGYGYMLAHELINDDPNSPPSALPPFVYVHLRYDYAAHELHKRFFCEDDQDVINKINWVLMKSGNYIAPGLFAIPKYQKELELMFPIKETVFHHLGRYLLHPSNSVWSMVMKYYNSYLAKAEERIGIQVRIFQWAPISIDDMYKQIVACTQEEMILPKLNPEQPEGSSLAPNKSHAVVVASLYGDFYERLKGMYKNSTSTRDIICVYQPSHEEKQKLNNQFHNQQALAEVWLLSFSDILVTTAGSTFGYVSYSLAGIKPWFLLSSRNQKIPDPPCRRALTIDPCFHAPPRYNCKTRTNADSEKQIRHMRRCEDYWNGIKLFD